MRQLKSSYLSFKQSLRRKRANVLTLAAFLLFVSILFSAHKRRSLKATQPEFKNTYDDVALQQPSPIPANIWQIYFSHGQLPASLVEKMSTWKSLNPSHHYHLIDDVSSAVSKITTGFPSRPDILSLFN